MIETTTYQTTDQSNNHNKPLGVVVVVAIEGVVMRVDGLGVGVGVVVIGVVVVVVVGTIDGI